MGDAAKIGLDEGFGLRTIHGDIITLAIEVEEAISPRLERGRVEAKGVYAIIMSLCRGVFGGIGLAEIHDGIIEPDGGTLRAVIGVEAEKMIAPERAAIINRIIEGGATPTTTAIFGQNREPI